jgi:hypothetical protein
MMWDYYIFPSLIGDYYVSPSLMGDYYVSPSLMGDYYISPSMKWDYYVSPSLMGELLCLSLTDGGDVVLQEILLFSCFLFLCNLFYIYKHAYIKMIDYLCCFAICSWSFTNWTGLMFYNQI